MKLRVHETAELELLAAARRYQIHDQKLGEAFVSRYESVILRILDAPTSWPRIETVRTRRHIRRCRLKRFPYYVAYEIKGDEIVVLAVAHAKRKPNYWLRRR